MKGSNSQKSNNADDGVSRDTLNECQRTDAARKASEAKHPEAGSKDASRPRVRDSLPERWTAVGIRASNSGLSRELEQSLTGRAAVSSG
jgi:hypothetical protein